MQLNETRTNLAGDRSAFADRDVGVRATQAQFAEFARFSLVFVPFM